MQEITCVFPSVFALTHGQAYTVLERRLDGSVRLRGDNGRIRWFPASLFTPGVVKVPAMLRWRFENDDEAPSACEDVQIEFDDGTWRWCTLATADHLGRLVLTQGGAFWSPQLVVVSSLAPETVEAALRKLDSEGDLLEATVPVAPADFETVFRALVGRPLQAVLAEVYVDEGVLDEDPPGTIWLEFEGCNPVGLHGHGDGEGLELAGSLPGPIEIEDVGEWVVRDVSRHTDLAPAIGLVLQRVMILEGCGLAPGEILGVRLDFGDGIAPVIYHWDDELEVSDEPELELSDDFPVQERLLG
ncbi:MAG: hypothetical protein JWM80_945 [Cyanobacteria bacterium RYN_339]|nr:hypothetical protein [Cyanobacteria bacterium RYN_339]